MGEKDKYSHFDMRAFRGHFHIASDHFEGMCKQFETLESLYKKAQSDNAKLTAELDAFKAEVAARKRECDNVYERLSWILAACAIDRDAKHEIEELLK